jgi:hypothetical protein
MRNTLRPGESALCDGLQGSSLVLENVESGVNGYSMDYKRRAIDLVLIL